MQLYKLCASVQITKQDETRQLYLAHGQNRLEHLDVHFTLAGDVLPCVLHTGADGGRRGEPPHLLPPALAAVQQGLHLPQPALWASILSSTGAPPSSTSSMGKYS